MNWFYLDSNRAVQGPISEAELKQLHATEILGPRALIAQEGAEGWKTLESYPLFTTPIQKTPPPSDLSAPTPTTPPPVPAKAASPEGVRGKVYSLTQTGPIRLQEITIARDTPRAIILKDYTKMPDGMFRKVLVRGVDQIAETPQQAITMFIKNTEERVSQLQDALNKEKAKLDTAKEMLGSIERGEEMPS